MLMESGQQMDSKMFSVFTLSENLELSSFEQVCIMPGPVWAAAS
jgi:hypothetical protein